VPQHDTTGRLARMWMRFCTVAACGVILLWFDGLLASLLMAVGATGAALCLLKGEEINNEQS
jgi:putative copper export protein